VKVLRITIPAGVSLPNHHHPVINAGVLQQGRLEVITEQGETLLLSAGDALIELVNRVHRGKSLGPEPALIVVVYAVAEGLPTTVLDPGPSPGL
jgi:quercetin dioxygenase-like cupin family protein